MYSLIRTLCATSLLFSVVALAGERPTEVMVVATMHGFHQDHESFDFEGCACIAEALQEGCLILVACAQTDHDKGPVLEPSSPIRGPTAPGAERTDVKHVLAGL